MSAWSGHKTNKRTAMDSLIQFYFMTGLIWSMTWTIIYLQRYSQKWLLEEDRVV